jgi:hypothetical protein
MTISRTKPDFALGDKLTSAEVDAIDTNVTNALDKRAGQSDTLGSVVLCEDEGRIVQTLTTGANANTTYTLATSGSVVRVDTTVTASRTYTLSTSDASVGDSIEIYVTPDFAYEITVKDQSSNTLIVLGKSECTWASFKCSSSGWQLWRSSAADLAIEAPGVRLSVEVADSYTRVPISDAVAATAIGLVPFNHDRIPLWNGVRWVSRRIPAFATNKITLSGLTSGNNYDDFAYWDSATSSVKLELSAAWTNDTTRNDALASVPTTALVTKAADPTRLYVGTFRSTSTTTTEDSKSKRFVWSMYNRVRRELSRIESTASWTMAAGGFRQANASTSNQVEYVAGFGDVALDLELRAMAQISGTARQVWVGIGLDSTTTEAGTCLFGGFTPQALSLQDDVFQIGASYRGAPGFGYHKLVWLEACSGATATFYGSFSGQYANGLAGSIEG